jgi:O-antigen/teichoic acid export membrane protein
LEKELSGKRNSRLDSLIREHKVILGNFGYVSTAFVLVNLFGYAFHAVLSRRLGPAGYGEFSAMYAFLLALSRPASYITSAVARIGSGRERSPEGFGEMVLFGKRLALLIGIGLGLLPVLLYPILKDWLKVAGIELYLSVSITLLLWAWLGALRGFLTAMEDFLTISIVGTIEAASRAGLGILMAFVGLGALGGLSSSLVAAGIAILMIQLKFVGNGIGPHDGTYPKKTPAPYARTSILVFSLCIPIGFLLEMDVALARRYFLAEMAGIYAASALVGKGVLAFTTVLSAVLYPRLVKAGVSAQGLRYLLLGVILTVLLFALFSILLHLFGRPAVSVFFGEGYVGAAGLVARYTGAILPLALHLQVLNYVVAVGGVKEAIWLWVLMMIYYVVLELASKDISSYLLGIFFTHLILAPITFLIMLKGRIKT